MNDQLEIGEYTISKIEDVNFPDGLVYIRHESGEGMGVGESKFEELIRDYFEENF